MTLKFVESNHSYWLDGRRTTGVTTLLGKGIPKPAIPYWSAKMVAEYVAENRELVETLWDQPAAVMIAALKSVPWVKRDQAAINGTDIHNLAEKIVHGEEVGVPEHLLPYVEGYLKWLDDFGVQPILTEKPVASRQWGYCGRADFVGVVGALGSETWCLDWKTSSGVYGETALQTAAYARAEFWVDPPDWDTEHPMPHIDRIGVVHITADGTTMHDLGDIDRAFKIFTHAAFLAKQTDYLKGVVGDPIILDKEPAA